MRVECAERSVMRATQSAEREREREDRKRSGEIDRHRAQKSVEERKK